jgi:uncharacterized membrane protein YhaH (DUF805 family)
MNVFMWIGLIIVIYSVAAAWAQIAEIVERLRRERGE